jgi:hypothetical protein
MQQPAETQCATEPLPLFRPEVVCKQERFFGEVLLIRPFSVGFLGWLIIGAAALTCCVLFFCTYTETAPTRVGLWHGPVAAHRRLIQLFEPSAVRGKPHP